VKREQDLTTLLIAIRDGISAEDLKRVEPDLADLIGRCVRTNPAKRPAMTAVLAELEGLRHPSGTETDEGVMFDLLGAAPAPAGAISAPAAPAEGLAPSAAQQLTESTLGFAKPGETSAPAPTAVPPAPTATQMLTGSTLVFAKPQAGPASAPATDARPGPRRWMVWMAAAFVVAVISVAAIFYFRPLQRSTGGPPQSITQGAKPGAVPGEPSPAPSAPNLPSGESRDRLARAVRFTAGILLMIASLVIGFWLRKWLGSRSQVKSQAYELVFGSRERTDLSATIALQLQDLVANVRKLDQRILAGTVALMLEEYGRATDTKDRQAALMNVVALSEKLAVRLSPWYERYKEIIASAVAVMGGVSGLMTAINSVLSHKH